MSDDSHELIPSKPTGIATNSGKADAELIDRAKFQQSVELLGDPVKLHKLRVKLADAILQVIDPENLASWDQQLPYGLKKVTEFDALNVKLFVPRSVSVISTDDENYTFPGDHIHHIHIHIKLDRLSLGAPGVRQIRLIQTMDTLLGTVNKPQV